MQNALICLRRHFPHGNGLCKRTILPESVQWSECSTLRISQTSKSLKLLMSCDAMSKNNSTNRRLRLFRCYYFSLTSWFMPFDHLLGNKIAKHKHKSPCKIRWKIHFVMVANSTAALLYWNQFANEWNVQQKCSIHWNCTIKIENHAAKRGRKQMFEAAPAFIMINQSWYNFSFWSQLDENE